MTIDKCMYKLHLSKGLFRHKRRLGEGAEVTWMGWMFSITPPAISQEQDLAFLLGGFNSSLTISDTQHMLHDDPIACLICIQEYQFK